MNAIDILMRAMNAEEDDSRYNRGDLPTLFAEVQTQAVEVQI